MRRTLGIWALGFGLWALGFGICLTSAFASWAARLAGPGTAAATLSTGMPGPASVLPLALLSGTVPGVVALARTTEARWLSTRRSLLRTAHRWASTIVPLAAWAIAVELAPASAWLSNRELRNLAFRHLTLRSRQRRANEPTMHWTFVVS